MWAICKLQMLRTSPPNLFSTSKLQPPAYPSSIVTARGRWQRRRPKNDYEYDSSDTSDDDEDEEEEEEEEEGVGGSDVIDIESPSSNPSVREETQPRLSGSDVFWAMQRAHKSKAAVFLKSKNKSKSKSKTNTSANINIDGRPICIKDEWITRLDDLDNRLRNLLNSLY